MIKYEHQLKDYDFKQNARMKRKHRKGARESWFSDDIFTFDTETTSAWIDENGKVTNYTPGKPAEYWNNLQPLALCYLWQFGVNDIIYYGRDIKDFVEVLEDIPPEVRIIIWVHNLSFDAHFLFNVLSGLNMFCRTPHKPMKMVSKKYPNIEFRCSYMLTRLSLDSWGKSLGVYKLTGTIDYNVLRTPLTPLDEDVMKYAEQDLLVIYAGIKDYLKRYKRMEDIPLTQTGTVRREIKNLLTEKDPGYMKFLKKLVPKDASEYKMLRDVFSGGYTHANRLHAGVVQTGHIEHYDFASSYPTCMICEKYPYSPWIYTGLHEMPPDNTFDDFAYIMELEFTNIECITFNTYIQASKTATIGYARYDNGRLISAEKMQIKITELDWLTIRDTYTWDDLKVIRLYKSRKKYLPRKFIEYVLKLYENKTLLKNAKEGSAEYDLYCQSKQYINSLFGMMVTALLQSDVNFDNDTLEWSIDTLTEDAVNEHLDKLRAWFPHEKRYFLNYSWGVWVTAAARRRLWMCILGEKENGIFKNDNNVLYADTDSIFILGEHDFSWYNDLVKKDLLAACDHYGIDHSKIEPCTPDGKRKPLGVFEREDDIEEFITLGAKRYCERRATDHKLHLTISGINKGAVEVLEDDIENFMDGLNFDKDHKSVKKQLTTYLTDQPDVTWPDGYRSTYRSGINLRANGYLLSISNSYKKLIHYSNLRTSELPENLQNHLRGRWI